MRLVALTAAIAVLSGCATTQARRDLLDPVEVPEVAESTIPPIPDGADEPGECADLIVATVDADGALPPEAQGCTFQAVSPGLLRQLLLIRDLVPQWRVMMMRDAEANRAIVAALVRIIDAEQRALAAERDLCKVRTREAFVAGAALGAGACGVAAGAGLYGLGRGD